MLRVTKTHYVLLHQFFEVDSSTRVYEFEAVIMERLELKPSNEFKLFAKIGDTGKKLCYHICSNNKNNGILYSKQFRKYSQYACLFNCYFFSNAVVSLPGGMFFYDYMRHDHLAKQAKPPRTGKAICLSDCQSVCLSCLCDNLETCSLITSIMII